MKTTQVKLVNLTPHPITLLNQTCRLFLTVEPTGLARVSTQTEIVGIYRANGIDICRTHTTYGEVEGLPDPTPGTLYIVSSMVVSALASKGIHRDDVVVPGMQVRDENGQVSHCRSLDN